MADEYDIVSDIDEGVDTSTTSNTGGTANNRDSSVEEPSDVRSLLQKAIKESATETPAENEQTAGDRPRGPDGKFLPKTKAEGEQAPQEGEQQQAQQQNTQEAQGDLIQRTEAVISALPEEAQENLKALIAERDNAFNNWARPIVERLNGLEAINQMIAPRVEAWALNGLTPHAAVNQILALSDFASRDPAGFIRVFADQHDIDLTNLPEDGGIDPVQQLAQQVQGLQTNFEQYQTVQQQSQVDRHYQSIVENFQSARGADGQPLRPYYAQVESDMTRLIPGIREANPGLPPEAVLEKAYNDALWVNPQVRAKVQEQQRIAEARERTARAARAGSSVSGAPLGEPASPVPVVNSVRDAIYAAMGR